MGGADCGACGRRAEPDASWCAGCGADLRHAAGDVLDDLDALIGGAAALTPSAAGPQATLPFPTGPAPGGPEPPRARAGRTWTAWAAAAVLVGGGAAALMARGDGRDAVPDLGPVSGQTAPPSQTPPDSPPQTPPDSPSQPVQVAVDENANGEAVVSANLNAGVIQMRPLSPGTTVTEALARTLAGRRVVEVVAGDGVWETTYYWDYLGGRLHFVGQNRQTGEVNVSQDPDAAAVIRAALGTVPPQTFQRPARRTPTFTRSSGHVVMMGAFDLDDDRALQGGVSRALRAGYPIRVMTYEDIGIDLPYVVVFAGPFTEGRARRVAADARAVVPDAYVRTF